jgi:predicted nucleic acid-binding protein
LVLADTSIWIDFARQGSRGKASAMRELLDAGQVVTCGPVAAELLAGSDGEVAERMWATLSSLPWAELDPGSWRQVGYLARSLRREGETLPLTDLVIAVAAVESGHALWSLDSDFERIAPVLDGLELYAPA